MKRLLLFVALALLAGGYWMIQRAPHTVSAVSTPSPLIVIDPGHGGRDPGTVNGPHWEKVVTLQVALQLGTLLQQNGDRVVFTRSQDVSLSYNLVDDLTMRAALANRLGARVFVTIHVNSEPSKTAWGPIVYYPPEKPDSRRLAYMMTEAIRATTGQYHAPRPIRQWVLHRTTMPAVNVELGFLSHSHDLRRLESPAYQNQLARAMALGIQQYLNS